VANPNPNPEKRLENLKPWKPGQSGNPEGGKPSIVRALKRLMLEDPAFSEEEAARIMWSHFKDGNPAAIKQIADRIDGPIVQKVELDDVSNLSPEEREARLDQLADIGRARAAGSLVAGADESDDLAQ